MSGRGGRYRNATTAKNTATGLPGKSNSLRRPERDGYQNESGARAALGRRIGSRAKADRFFRQAVFNKPRM